MKRKERRKEGRKEGRKDDLSLNIVLQVKHILEYWTHRPEFNGPLACCPIQRQEFSLCTSPTTEPAAAVPGADFISPLLFHTFNS
jgi:hypothetical protein